MSEIIPETAEEILTEKTEADIIMENTKFLLDFVSTHSNTLFWEDGFFYEAKPGTDPRKWLVEIITGLLKQGYVIEDFQAIRAGQFLKEPVFSDEENGSFRMGKGISAMDMEEARKVSEGIVRDKADVLYEYVPNRPFNGNRDLFLSTLWKNGVRSGIQLDGVTNAMLERGETIKKFTIAKQIDAIPPKDADIKPVTQILKSKKIKTPSEAARADLHEYECTFPEVTEKEGAGFKLVRKDPMVDGTEGITTDGTIIKIKSPTDKDLSRLVWTGTSLIKEGEIEYIVAERLGFIFLDPRTKQISITDEINNSDPIGPKTGNIDTQAEKFKQHTSIEHGYKLTCNALNMIGGLMAGTVVSRWGGVQIAQTVAEWGKVTAWEGDVTVGSKILGGMVEAFWGKVTVPYAEWSVIIGHEIDVGQAINCILIGDIINIKNNCGSSFFGKKVHVQHMDFTGDFDHEIKGIIYVHDNLVARKTIKIIERSIGNEEVLTREIYRLHNEILADGWNTTKDSIKKKLTEGRSAEFTEHEATLWKKFQLYKDYETRKKELTEMRGLLDNLEEDNEANTGLVVDSIEYPKWALAEMAQKKEKGVPVVFSNLEIEFYSAHDIPCHLIEMAEWPLAAKRYFVDIANQRTCGMIAREDPRTHPFHSEKSWQGTVDIPYSEMREYILKRKEAAKMPQAKEKNQIIPRSENRLNINSMELIRAIRKDPSIVNKTLCIPVNIDGRYDAYIHDFSGGGVSLVIDMNQKNLPIFEIFEELSVEFEVNRILHRQILIVTSVIESEDRILKIGGYYINLSEDMSNILYRSKNFLELTLNGREGKL